MIAKFFSHVVVGFFKTWLQSATDRMLGRTQQVNENLAASNKELDRHAQIDSDHVDTNDAYTHLGMPSGTKSDGHGDSVPKVPESKPGSVVNIKGPTKPSS